MPIRLSEVTLISAAMLLPVAAQAQDRPAPGDNAAASHDEDRSIRAELDELRSQLAIMTERVRQLEAAQTDGETATADATPVQAAPAAKAAPETRITWKGAPQIENDAGWSFKPRGRMNYDAGFTSVPASTGRTDGFGNEARRVRLGVEGTVPGGFGYKFEADFASDGVEITDAIGTWEDGGLVISAGQHNPFQSLEELTSSRFSSFIERAAFTDAFGFERRVGLSAQYGAGIVLAQAGIFTDNIDALSNRNIGGDARLVVMPSIGSTRLHLGGSLHYAELSSGFDSVRYRQRPLVHFTSDRFIDTGTMNATRETGYGAEFAAISGRFHVAGEGFWQTVARPGLADPTFFGAYAEVGFFLTPGDTRGYKKGIFDRTKPARPVDKGGIGAVQVNLRYDRLDLDDIDVSGGKQNLYGISLVWAPTDYTRLLLNYARIDYVGAVYPTGTGDTSYGVNSFGARAQIDF